MKRSTGRDEWVIEPRGVSFGARIGEAWRARALFPFLAHRSAEQIVSRTLLGYLWLILRPGIPAAVMVFVFGVLVHVGSTGEIPYLVFFLYGLTAWSLFDAPLMWGTRGLYFNRSLLSKMYFPRILVPLASTFPGLLDFAVHAFFLALALIGFAVFAGDVYVVFGPGLLLAFAALVTALMLAVAISLFTSLWDYQARDTRYTISVISRFLLYLTPIIYPSTNIAEAYRPLYFANPLAGVVETFRYGMTGQWELIPLGGFLYALVFAALALFAGVLYFCAVESAVIDRA